MRLSFTVLTLLAGLTPALCAADITLASGVSLGPQETAALPLFLTNPAGSGGVVVSLSSSDTSKVTIAPDNIYIPAGATTPYSQPQLTGVNFGSATISAAAYGLTGTSQTVQVLGRLSGPASLTMERGATLNVTLALSIPSPTAVTLAVTSDNPAAASVPSGVTIPANGNSVTVPVTGVGVGATTIHASALPSVAAFSFSISVVAPSTITLSGNVAVPLGLSAAFPVTLGTPAPNSGLVVTLTSSNPTVVSISPGSVFIAPGAIAPSVQPQVTGDNIGIATITATAPGYTQASQAVPVTATVTLSPSPLVIPAASTRLLSIALSSAAPSGVPITPDRGAGGYVDGLTIQLSSSDPRVATLQPAVQFYPDGSSVTTVVVVVTGVGPGTAVIHASALPFIPDTTVTVTVPSATGASSITASSGTPQTATAGTPFGLPLAATVSDGGGNPVSGATVTFFAPASGAGVTFAGGVNTAVTNASGVATSPAITANGQAGTYVVTASVAGVAGSAVFALTNVNGAPGAITLPGNVTIGTLQTVPFPVTLSTPAPAGGVTVTLSSGDSSKVLIAPPTVSIAAGSVLPAVQPQVTGINFGSAAISASAAGYTSASQVVKVAATLAFSPSTVTMNGLGTQNVNLTLTSPAPAGGLTVSLNSNNPGVITVPGSANFPPNSTSVSVPVNAVSAGLAAVTATAGVPNVPNAVANITVTSASAGITLAAGITLGPGETAAMPLFLTSPAGPFGVVVSLSSSDTSKVTIAPDNIYIPAGATTPYSQPQLTGVNFGSATISAAAYGLTGTSQTVQVLGRLSGPASLTMERGATLNVTLALSIPSPTAVTLAVSSDNPAVASVPSGVTIPANGNSVIVPVTGVGVGATTIHASALPSVAAFSFSISVVAPSTITLSGNVAVPLGLSAAFPITLGTPAPASGLVVTLTSSNPTVVSISPGSVFIPPGAVAPAVQPQVTGDNIGIATITATAPGYTQASQAVPVTATVTLSPSPLVIPAAGTRLLSIALSSAAPSGVPITPDRGAGGYVDGLTVQLSSSDPRVATLQPTVQFYPDGSSVTTVVVVVTGVGPGTAVIHASALPFIPDTTTTVIVQ